MREDEPTTTVPAAPDDGALEGSKEQEQEQEHEQDALLPVHRDLGQAARETPVEEGPALDLPFGDGPGDDGPARGAGP